MVFRRKFAAEVKYVIAQVTNCFELSSNALPCAAEYGVKVLPVATVAKQPDVLVESQLL
jgi:hypothetical protein